VHPIIDVPPKPPVPVKKYNLKIITPFDRPVVYIDRQRMIAVTTFHRDQFMSTFELPKGNHTIRVSDGSRKYVCPDSTATINLKNHMELAFKCQPVPPPVKKYTVTLRIIDIAQKPDGNIIVFVDSQEVKNRDITPVDSKKGSRGLFKKKDLLITIPDIPEGRHTFQVQYNCHYPNGKMLPLKVGEGNTSLEEQGSSYACVK
jgi:hypothetical protein